MENHGSLSPLCEDVDVEDGELSPLREEEDDVVDEGQPSPPREDAPLWKRWGFSMLEVFSVRTVNTQGAHQVRLYGEIKYEVGTRVPQLLYSRNRENSEYIRTGDLVLLNGPTQSFNSSDCFAIDVYLINEYGNGLLDDEVISRSIAWNGGRNKFLSEEVIGLFGGVIVNFVVMSEAVAATLEFTLLNVYEENSARLFGKVTARNGFYKDEMAESVLFRNISDEDIIVKPGHIIPLSRSIVSVQCGSSLIVEANLFDSLFDEIAKGIAEFPAQPSGTTEENISGKYGEIQVKVTWVI